MDKGYVKVKEWFINEQQEKAIYYNMFVDIYSRDEIGRIKVDENGFVVVLFMDILRETKKSSICYIVNRRHSWQC